MSAGNLFATGWSMSHTAATHPAKPKALILTSSSSRTTLAAAFAAKFHKLPLEVVGITSASHADFVLASGFYDTVCLYEEVASLRRQLVAVLDVAGNAQVQAAIYRNFGNDIVYYGGVGMSHVQSAGQRASLTGLGGAKATPFLVFTALEAIAKVYGKKEMQSMLVEATAAYKKL